jgi:hypothetical protein
MYNTTRTMHAYTELYGQWTYTKITIVLLLTNNYGKISTVVMFDGPEFFWRKTTGASE